jgi:hypothetical protein
VIDLALRVVRTRDWNKPEEDQLEAANIWGLLQQSSEVPQPKVVDIHVPAEIQGESADQRHKADSLAQSLEPFFLQFRLATM